MLDRRIIRDILDRVKIEEIIGGYVALKRSGNSLKGLCPFHGDTSPSFYVNPVKGVYYCFGCKAGGNVFNFLQEIEGKSFGEVVRELAEKEGIEIPDNLLSEGESKEARERYARRRRQLELLKRAAMFYEKFLWNSGSAKGARLYLHSRGINEETARTFMIGFAPKEGIGVEKIIKSVSASIQDGVEVGLIRIGKDGSLYELFRNRIMFPIMVPGGNVVAFSGRALPGTEEEKVKYFNSPESRYFRKGEILYGLPQALVDIRKHSHIILVEGNFDVLSMAQNGYLNTAAPLGSALTQKHMEQLKRMDIKATLLFDGDEAGIKAVHRSFEIIVASGVTAFVATLPQGYDPDSFLQKEGRQAMGNVIKGSRNIVDFIIDGKVKEAGESETERAKMLRSLWRVLRQSPDPLVKIEILGKLARAFKINEKEVRKRLGFEQEMAKIEVATNQSSAPVKTGKHELQKEYEILISAIIEYPGLANEIYRMGSEIIDDFSVLNLIHSIAIESEGGNDVNFRTFEVFNHEFIKDENLRDWFMKEMVKTSVKFEAQEDAKNAAVEALNKIKQIKIQREIETNEILAKDALKKGNLDEYAKILAEKQKLRKQAKKILF